MMPLLSAGLLVTLVPAGMTKLTVPPPTVAVGTGRVQVLGRVNDMPPPPALDSAIVPPPVLIVNAAPPNVCDEAAAPAVNVSVPLPPGTVPPPAPPSVRAELLLMRFVATLV